MPVLDLTFCASLPLPDTRRRGKPIVRTEPGRHTVRLRRDLPEGGGRGRRWQVEVEISVRIQDPEETLRECHGFLVDSVDGRELGVVDDVEAAGPGGLVSAVVVASNWFGRRRVRVDAEQIEVVIPAQRRLIVREPPSGFHDLDPGRT